MVCIGYGGMEAFDIVLYLGQALVRLNIPVLIIDLSDTGAMTKAIYHGMDIDSTDTIINYRGINYIRSIPDYKDFEDYTHGVVFIVFGLKYVDIKSIKLDFMSIVVDSFPSNIDRVNTLISKMPLRNIQTRLLIRNITCIDDVERVKRNMTQDYTWSSVNYLYLEVIDIENAIRCQRLQTIDLRRISRLFKKFIINEINAIRPDIMPSKIRKRIF
ncbi:MAG: hypothetical protein GX321_01160 [Clostridiales bacterium]|nr:hypothetical protein [Clostridiales bacterium]